MTARRADAAFGAPFELPELAGTRADWLAALAGALYGAVPVAPERLEVSRAELPGVGADLLTLQIVDGDRALEASAALWLPRAADGPVPIICGLGFLGPLGVLSGDGFPLDGEAVVLAPERFGQTGGRLTEAMRGKAAYRWPVKAITEAGFGLMLSCYGSWVPDDARRWRDQGVSALLGGPNCGAISLWAWALMRLVDASLGIEGIDPERVFVAGHSRLGKAALWAAAWDARIAGVYGNNAGCAGAAPAAHEVGEGLGALTQRFGHWLKAGASLPDGLDQHFLLAAIAPRRLYLASARDDLWADPVGSYLALVAASEAWGCGGDWPSAQEIWENGGQVARGALGHHLRDGGHEMLPEDWAMVLPFLAGQSGSFHA